MSQIRREIKRFCDANSMAVEFHHGGKHDKVFVNGALACSIHRDGKLDSGPVGLRNTFAMIRRAAAKAKP